MPSDYTQSLGLELQETGTNLNVWGLKLNNALTLIDDAIAGIAPIALTGNYTLTNTLNMVNEARKPILLFTDGGLTATPTVTLPPSKRLRYVENRGGNYAITLTAGGASASVPPNRKVFVLCDGANIFVIDYFAITYDASTAAVDAKNTAVASATSAQSDAAKALTQANRAKSEADRAQGYAQQVRPDKQISVPLIFYGSL